MVNPRKILFLLLALSLMWTATAPAFAQSPAPELPSQGKVQKSPTDMINLMDPIGNLLSGPAWLMAEGLDTRPWLDRPGWNTLSRQNLASAQSPMNGDDSPLLQSIGPGVLVPYRDPAPAFSRDLLVTRDFSDIPLQTEPDLAVNPNDPDHLILGVIDYNFPNNSAYVSIDGGATWEGPKQLKYLREDQVSGGDPVVTFDSQGNAYFASISIGTKEYTIGNAVGFALVSSIAVASSDDGGYTWSEPVSSARSQVETDVTTDASGRIRGEVRLKFLDKPWMTIGPHPTIEGQEVIYVTYVEFDTKYQILYIGEIPTLGAPEVETTPRLVYSSDGGTTWSDPVAAGPTVRRIYGEVGEPDGGPLVVGTKRVVQGAVPAVDSQGTLYVIWLDSTDDESMKGLGEFYMARSEDGGRTFADPVRIASFLEPGFRPRNAFFRYWASAFPKVAVGPDDELYVVYTALPPDRPSDEGDVYFLRSLDGGDRWSRPQRLNQDDTDSVQFFPAVDVGTDGTIHVMWGDMRDDPVQTRYHIYYTRSGDQGDTWGFELPELDLQVGDTRVTDFPSNPNKGFPSGLFLGDYFAIAATEEDAYLVWADTRLGEFGPINQKIGFTRQRPIAAPEIFISPDAGPAGETITVQGHGFQPDMDIFLQMGGVTVAAGRTDPLGRISTDVFVPISGEGAHQVQLVDESGNFATTSFYMEFGFDNVRKVVDAQENLQSDIQGLSQQLATLPGEAQPQIDADTLQNMQNDLRKLNDLELQLQEIKDLLETNSPGAAVPAPVAAAAVPGSEPTTSLPWGWIGLIGLVLGAALAWAWSSYQRSRES